MRYVRGKIQCVNTQHPYNTQPTRKTGVASVNLPTDSNIHSVVICRQRTGCGL